MHAKESDQVVLLLDPAIQSLRLENPYTAESQYIAENQSFADLHHALNVHAANITHADSIAASADADYHLVPTLLAHASVDHAVPPSALPKSMILSRVSTT